MKASWFSRVCRGLIGVFTRTVCFFPLVALPTNALAEGVVNSCTEADLRAALTGGGTVTFACNGTITLANTITITNDTAIDVNGRNVTISGGGTVRILVVSSNTQVVLNGLKIVDGRHSADGGGILNSGTLTIIGCTFSNNVVSGTGLLRGGAVLNSGTLELIDCTFVTNRIQGSGYGGAIHNMGIFGVRQCTFVGNDATYGGAIANQISDTWADVPAGVTNCTFWMNKCASPLQGGGICNFRTSTRVMARVFVVNCTFVENVGGALGVGAGLAGSTWVANSILGPTGGFIDGGNNLFWYLQETGFDLRVGPLANNGGPTWTMALQPDSPALDQGNNALCPPTDQRGVARPYGPRCDIGAYEAAVSPTPAFLQFAATAYNSSESSVTATVAVVRVGNSGGTASIRYSASDGTATHSYDYMSATGTVNFAAGHTQATFTVSMVNDSTPEANETVNLRLFDASGGPSLGSPATAVLTIVDDDPPQPGALSFMQPAYSVAESSLQARLWVVRTGGTNGTVSVDFTTVDGTAVAFNGDPLSGTDYVATNGTLTFADGEISKQLIVRVIGFDFRQENTESFSVRLSNPRGGAMLGNPAVAVVTIVDRTRLVTACDETTVREAVSVGGTVVLACNETIVLSSPLVVSNGTIISAGFLPDRPGNFTPTLSGGNATRLFNIRPGVSLSLFDLTLADGLARGINGSTGQSGGAGEGGGVYNDGGTLVATNCAFLRNRAQGGDGGSTPGPNPPGAGGAAQGGAIYNHNGQVILFNCGLTANEARGGNGGSGSGTSLGGESGGGAIYTSGSDITLVSCTVLENVSVSGRGRRFGALYLSELSSGGAIELADGTVRLSDSVLARNASQTAMARPARGGAITQRGGALEIEDSLLLANRAEGGRGWSPIIGAGNAFGGTLYVLSGTALLANSTLASNHVDGGIGIFGAVSYGAGFGGAVFNGASLDARNCTISGNEARTAQEIGTTGAGSGFGGGMYQGTGTMVLTHVTLAENAARSVPGRGVAQGGAIFASTDGRVTLFNSIVANSPGGSNAFGVLIDGGHNLSSDASCNFGAAGSLNNTDPKLGPLADYTGPTPTMALLAGSPAIDAAGSAACTPTDQRGRARPVGAACDIGAFESSEPYTVLGQFNGFIPPPGSAIVSAGSSSAQVDVFGKYVLHGLATGIHIIKPESALAVFVPKSREVNVLADAAGVHFTSYRTNAIVISRLPLASIRAVFAGEADIAYEVEVSVGLPPAWDHYSTLTSDSDGLIEWTEIDSSPGAGRFFRVKRQ
jgi:Calx-beta domain-containing protein